MIWDWKRAIGVEEGTLVKATETSGVRRSPTGQKARPASAGPERAPIIAWRSTGWSYGQPGGAALVGESDHPCPFCRGAGEVAGGGVCPVCNGHKTVHVKAPSVRCAFCGGQGQMPPRSNLTCWVCKGKGLVSVSPPVRTCPDCLGKGKKPCESLYCPRCKGVGVVLLQAVSYK